MAVFVSGLDLNEQFYKQVLAPMMAEAFPTLVYSAGRLGDGSEVLGYDTEMSTDHDWGIRQQVFLAEADAVMYTAVSNHLRHHLHHTFKRYPVDFGEPDEHGTRLLTNKHEGPVEHRIEITTLSAFFEKQLNIDLSKSLEAVDWFTIPQQLLLSVTKGRVFADPTGELTAVRQKLAYFPEDVWLYLLACQWGRIGEEEHFMGRTGIVGDEIGSQLLAGRLVHDLMLLCFLMEKTYAPYAKWFGTAFGELACARQLQPILAQILSAPDWKSREKWLCEAYSFVAKLHNGLKITEPMRTDCVSFHKRPFQVIFAGDFQTAIMEKVSDPMLKQLDNRIGSIDQFSHSTPLRSYPHLHRRLRGVYQS